LQSLCRRQRWSAARDDTGVVDYLLKRNGRVIALPTAPEFIDTAASRSRIYRYELIARDAAGNSSQTTAVILWPAGIFMTAAVLLVLGIVIPLALKFISARDTPPRR
jgi:hypothetical protein